MKKLAGGLLALSTTLLALPADACWDGYASTVGDVTFQRASDPAAWRADDAWYATQWAARLDALLPEGVTLDVMNTYVSCDGAAACDTVPEALGSDDPSKLFGALAQAFGRSWKERAAALATTQRVYTVQVFAGAPAAARRERARLLALAAEGTIDAEGDRGFFEAGGFPAENPSVHAIRDRDDADLVRVVVGTYPSATAAREAARKLELAHIPNVIKELPRGQALDEPSSSARG